MEQYSKKLKIACTIAIVLYLLFFVWALYFKFGDINDVKSIANHHKDWSLKERFLFDIIPFDFRNTHQKFLHFIINILNFIVFAPLGVALCMRSKGIKWKRHALFCFLVSLTFELVQLFTFIGGFASDDLLMNTLGYFLGALVYYLIFRKLSDKVNYYIIVACDVFLSLVVIFAIITMIPILGEYIEIIKAYAFK